MQLQWFTLPQKRDHTITLQKITKTKLQYRTDKWIDRVDDLSTVETVGCCHLEVFVRILIGEQERVPLMAEHNREATLAKTEESHYFIFFPHWTVFAHTLPAVSVRRQ